VAGKTDLEDAVKRLDNLTQEEARMAIAEVLRITHNVRNVVEAVDDKVADVGDKVQGVDEKVQIVIDGACVYPLGQSIISNTYTFRWQGRKSGGEGSNNHHATDGKQRGRN
jgi:hypothetical protein